MAVTTPRFLWFSDFHYDPYYGQEGAYGRHGNESCTESTEQIFGRYHCDSSYELIRSAITSASGIVPDANFAIVTGDFARHGTDELENSVQELGKILGKVAETLHDVFDNEQDDERSLSIIPCLGNNDFTPDYYVDITERPNSLLAVAADAFAGTLLSKFEEETFRDGGYLTRNVSDALTVVSINTLVYCAFHQPEQFDIEDPFDQFSWLESQLSMARSASRRVFVIGHIPPTIGSYRKEQYWAEGYRQRFNRLVLGEYSDVVAAQMYGHQHSDEFRVFPYQKKDDGVMILSPSVTPLFGNNPSFRAVSYNDKAQILDYVTYYTDLSEPSESFLSWKKLYSFVEEYNVTDVSVPNLRKIVNSIADTAENGGDNPTLQKLLRYQHVDTPHDTCVGRCQFEWACLLQVGSLEEYNACLGALTPDGKKITISAAMIALVVFWGLAIILYLFFRCYQKIKKGSKYHLQEDDEGDLEMKYDDDNNNATNGELAISNSTSDDDRPSEPKIV